MDCFFGGRLLFCSWFYSLIFAALADVMNDQIWLFSIIHQHDAAAATTAADADDIAAAFVAYGWKLALMAEILIVHFL